MSTPGVGLKFAAAGIYRVVQEERGMVVSLRVRNCLGTCELTRNDDGIERADKNKELSEGTSELEARDGPGAFIESHFYGS
jgi:hypothetical protein